MVLTGCIDWTTGKSSWQAPYDCDYPDVGCIISTGVHAGHVAVTICDIFYGEDVYYGCIRWTLTPLYERTGYWRIEVPEDICCDCNTGVILNALCWDGDTTARHHIIIDYTGVWRCSDDSLIEINDANICVSYDREGPIGHYGLYTDLDGYGHELELIDSEVEHRVYYPVYEEARWGDGGRYFHYTDAVGRTKFLANDYEIGDCGGSVVGYGGTARLIDVCDPCAGEVLWVDDTDYVVFDVVQIGGEFCYTAKVDHNSDIINDRPETGTNWTEFWRPTVAC